MQWPLVAATGPPLAALCADVALGIGMPHERRASSSIPGRRSPAISSAACAPRGAGSTQEGLPVHRHVHHTRASVFARKRRTGRVASAAQKPPARRREVAEPAGPAAGINRGTALREPEHRPGERVFRRRAHRGNHDRAVQGAGAARHLAHLDADAAWRGRDGARPSRNCCARATCSRAACGAPESGCESRPS